jgi:hypothetical protein
MQNMQTTWTRTRRATPAKECYAVLVRLEPRDAERIRRRARAERLGVGPLLERLALERLARLEEVRDAPAQ